MKRAGMGYTSWAQLREIDEVVSTRLTRYRSKDRAGWPPPPKLTEEAQLGCPQLTLRLSRVVLLEGTDDGELTCVGLDPRLMNWMNDEDYRAYSCLDGIATRVACEPFSGRCTALRHIFPSRTALVLGNDVDEEAWHLPCLS